MRIKVCCGTWAWLRYTERLLQFRATRGCVPKGTGTKMKKKRRFNFGSLTDYDTLAQIIQEFRTAKHKQLLSRQEKLIQRYANVSGETFRELVVMNNFSHFLSKYSPKPGQSYFRAPKVKFKAIDPNTQLQIFYGIHPTPFGCCFLALASKLPVPKRARQGLSTATPILKNGSNFATDKEHICKLAFVDDNMKDNNMKKETQKIQPGWTLAPGSHSAWEELCKAWPLASIKRSQGKTKRVINQIFETQGRQYTKQPMPHLLVHGSPLQMKVWQALACLKKGEVATYSDLAAFIQNPKAVRAVASSVARNPISYLVPCHRIVSKSGKVHAYRWGSARKLIMLLWELAEKQARTAGYKKL